MRRATTHLADEELALYVDAIVLSLQDQLPKEILHHVMKCTGCKKELMELLDLMEGQDPRICSETHPFFGQTIG